jgi:F-type H+/Na+-transporting ATPase subunit alpha
MKDFNYYLNKTGEIGYVEQVVHSVCYVSGLPGARHGETVLFESSELGQIVTLEKEFVEVVPLTGSILRVGTRVARTSDDLSVPVGVSLLGKVIDPMGTIVSQYKSKEKTEADGKTELRNVDSSPPSISLRKTVTKPFDTGVSLVDLVVPVGKGQRELIIGDKGTGKSSFLRQIILYQALSGTICIYALVGKRQSEISELVEYLGKHNILQNTVVVATSSSQTSGMIYLTPYTAMTIAEFFRDRGMDVCLILDDLTTHAKYYREISLLAKRFPGRSSYPGDIFYTHARLLERAGSFQKGSITCLPVADSVLGDLAGYIQTNLMAMTDGHIFFDSQIFDEGKRPAINPFLSVTRVGRQAQTSLEVDLGRQITSFLVKAEKMRQFSHFGAEVGEEVKDTLSRAEKLSTFFNQSPFTVVPPNIGVLFVAGIWAGIFRTASSSDIQNKLQVLIDRYKVDAEFRKKIDNFVEGFSKFKGLVDSLRLDDTVFSL